MTVKELIEKLQEFPQDAEISVQDYEDDEWNILEIEFTEELVILKVEGESLI